MHSFRIFVSLTILSVGAAQKGLSQTTTRLPPQIPQGPSSDVIKPVVDLSKLTQVRLEKSIGLLKDGGLLSDALLEKPVGGGGEQLARTLSKVDLLALKADHSLMAGLERWLAKYNIQMPASLVDQIQHMEMCPNDAKDGLRHYCTKMPDAQYYDPWNPWCGYLECLDGVPTRKVCRPGTWMGYISDETRTLLTKDRMCRRPLKDPIRSGECQEQTDYHMCRRVGAIAGLLDATPIQQPPIEVPATTIPSKT